MEHADHVVYYNTKRERTKYRKLQQKYPAVCSASDVEALFSPGRSFDLFYDAVFKSECMYVDPACRGQSVIGKIIDALKHWCRSRGISELRLEVYNDNAAAIRAYQKAGFHPLSLQMRLGLPVGVR